MAFGSLHVSRQGFAFGIALMKLRQAMLPQINERRLEVLDKLEELVMRYGCRHLQDVVQRLEAGFSRSDSRFHCNL
jgi:hypothetical protein